MDQTVLTGNVILKRYGNLPFLGCQVNFRKKSHPSNASLFFSQRGQGAKRDQ